MTKKNTNKFVNDFFESQLGTEESIGSGEVIVEFEESKPSEVQKMIYVNAKFNTDITEIGYEFLATGEKNVVSVSNGKLYMLQGRQYYVPINNELIDSDNYNIKVHTDAADRFDVRYIKDGLAAVVPIRHNTILKSGERLCVLTKLVI